MVDLGILALVLISIVIGIWRGMVREVLSLIAWGLSFWLATHWSHIVSERLVALITSSALRHWVAWAILMVILRLAFEVVLKLVNMLISATGLKPLDRSFGALFGALRGIVMSILLALLINTLDIAAARWWQSARLRPALEYGATIMQPLLPSF